MKQYDSRQWMIRAFKLQGCRVCGVRYPEIPMEDLHCDHRDPDSNERGGIWVHFGAIQSHESIFTELQKCEVLCADHHYERHRTDPRRNGHSGEQGVLFKGTGEAWVIER